MQCLQRGLPDLRRNFKRRIKIVNPSNCISEMFRKSTSRIFENRFLWASIWDGERDLQWCVH
eukprot:2585847-Karenia_brevis.AAC.1